MSFSYLPALLRSTFLDLAHWLHKRSAARLPWLLTGILFAKGRRTVTSWFRAAGIRDDHRQGYVTVCAAGRAANSMALTVQAAVRPLLDRRRLLLGIDDTLTPRYGPHVKGCGIHHNHSPGPAGEPYVYGHVWVVLAALARHPQWDTIALLVQAQLYIRAKDVAQLPPERSRPFRTKLELAAEQLRWLLPRVENAFVQRWVAVDGGYAERPFLRPAKQDGWVVTSRLHKDAALWSVPEVIPPHERAPGRPPICCGPIDNCGQDDVRCALRTDTRMALRSRKIVTMEKLGSYPDCPDSRKKPDLSAIRRIHLRRFVSWGKACRLYRPAYPTARGNTG